LPKYYATSEVVSCFEALLRCRPRGRWRGRRGDLRLHRCALLLPWRCRRHDGTHGSQQVDARVLGERVEREQRESVPELWVAGELGLVTRVHLEPAKLSQASALEGFVGYFVQMLR